MKNQIFTENANLNKVGFAFMSWEQNPKKRNINNIVKFNVNSDTPINVGDVINGKKYVTVRTEWQNVNITQTAETK